MKNKTCDNAVKTFIAAKKNLLNSIIMKFSTKCSKIKFIAFTFSFAILIIIILLSFKLYSLNKGRSIYKENQSITLEDDITSIIENNSIKIGTNDMIQDNSDKPLFKTNISNGNLKSTKVENFKEKNNINVLSNEKKNTSGLKSIDFELTFYTGLPDENGGYSFLNCYGEQLTYGQVASNVYKKGTIIKLEGIGTFEVRDIGGNEFNSSTRLDVYIPPKNGESDKDYKSRVMALGRRIVKGYIIE